MIKYVCKSCNIDCETSECPICHGRAKAESRIYWCKNCNVPIYEEKCDICGQEGEYLTTDLRPVFPEERLLLEILIGEPFKYINSSVWNSTGNRYIVDGVRLKLPILKTKNIKDAKLKIECQITKYQMCIGCLACESVCKHNAMTIKKANDNINGEISYTIDDEKCVRCGECVNHFEGGCYMRKVLIKKRIYNLNK